MGQVPWQFMAAGLTLQNQCGGDWHASNQCILPLHLQTGSEISGAQRRAATKACISLILQ